MGNKNIQLNWSWPLISYKWLPEILASINHAIEPSWSGLHREMTAYSANTSIGNNIFSQLKTLLQESQLIQEQGKYITPTVTPIEDQVREHLLSVFSLSNLPWTLFYHHLVDKQVSAIFFPELKSNPPNQWPEVATYTVFKQWAEFFQYLELGFLIDSKQFIPVGAITSNMIHDTLFIDKCCKSLGDPRYLTGRDSLHTQADFLAWTSGETSLTVSSDIELSPRIPAEHIDHVFQTTNSSRRCHKSIKEGVTIWDGWILKHLKVYPFSNLTTLILTAKILLDFFLFGDEQFEPTDDIREVVLSARKKWENIPHFQIIGTIWKVLPKLYQDITRLTYGVTYYRNSLKKIDLFSNCIRTQILAITKKELEEVKKIPIRCFRTKRSLHSILHTTSIINTTLTRIEQKNSYVSLEEYVQDKFISFRSFLPTDSIDRRKLLDETVELIEFDKEDVETIIAVEYPVFSCRYQVPIIQLSYWAHLYYEIHNNHKLATIDDLQKKLTRLKNLKRKEIQHYNSNIDNWDKSLCAFQNQIKYLKGNSREKSKTTT